MNCSFQVSMIAKDDYVGRILTGRIISGVVRLGDKVHALRQAGPEDVKGVIHADSEDDKGVVKIEEGRVCDQILLVLNY